MAGVVPGRFTALGLGLLLGVQSHRPPELRDRDLGTTRRRCCRLSSVRFRPQRASSGLHHGVHQHQPPGTAALLGPSAEPDPGLALGGVGAGSGEAAAPLARIREGGAARIRAGEGALPRGAGPAPPQPQGLCGLLCLRHWNTKQSLDSTGQLSPGRKISSVYQEERKSVIFL